MTDKYRMLPIKILDTDAFASGTEASGTIGAAGDGHVYEIQTIYTTLTLGADAGVRIPQIEILDAVGGSVIANVGCANSGISKPSQTNKITAGMNLTSRMYGGGNAAYDHQNMELPASDEGGMLVGGGTVIRTSTGGLDATGDSDTYGKLTVYGRRFKLLR
jgi:hypothetical protein